MRERIIAEIAGAAMEGMLYEVSAVPKPGLVTPASCGAHQDMDYFTFLSSAAALHGCFDEMVHLGMNHQNEPIIDLLPYLRFCGMKYEKLMFSFTNGVNTHKGMIFTLGLLCGCAGWNIGRAPMQYEHLCELVAEMCAGICEREYRGLEQKKEQTKGEQIYLKYGIKGARGEVESGYQTIRRVSMPVYQQLRQDGMQLNEALVQTLLHLIAKTHDTNIISRHDLETAAYAREYAAAALSQGGILTGQGRACIGAMEQDFIKRNISPGGCADLLAATHFLYRLEHTDFNSF